MPNLALQANYSFTRTTDFAGAHDVHALDRQHRQRLFAGRGPHGHAARRLAVRVQTFIPNPAMVAAAGNGRFLTNWEGYTSRHGLELSLVKRLSDRGWRGRRGVHQRERVLRREPAARQPRQPDAARHRTARQRRRLRGPERGQRCRRHLHPRQVAVQRERPLSGAGRDRSRSVAVWPPGISVPGLPDEPARPRRIAARAHLAGARRSGSRICGTSICARRSRSGSTAPASRSWRICST